MADYRQRNIIDQMKCVEVLRTIRPISTTAFTLWFDITMEWNKAKWTNSPLPFSFGDAQARKMLCNRSSVYRARDTLIDKGYIAVRNGKNLNQQAGIYPMYIPQYINDIIIDGKCSFDRLQSLIDGGTTADDLQCHLLPNVTDRKSQIEEVKKRLQQNIGSI